MSAKISRRDFQKRAAALSAAGVLGPPALTPPLVEVWIPAAGGLSVPRSTLRPRILLQHLRKLHNLLERDQSKNGELLELVNLEGARREARDALMIAEDLARAGKKTQVWMYDLYYFVQQLAGGGIDLERPFTVEYLPVRGRGKPWHLGYAETAKMDKHMFCVTQRADPTKKLADEEIHKFITTMGKEWNRQVKAALAKIACD